MRRRPYRPLALAGWNSHRDGVAFSPDGQTVAFGVFDIGVTGVIGGHVIFVRVSDGALIRQVNLGFLPAALAASPNSTELVIGSYNKDRQEQGELSFWDWPTA